METADIITHFPESITRLTEGKPFTEDSLGCSGSRVLIFEDCVLKIEKRSTETEEAIRMMRWLEGKLPVPKVLCQETEGNTQYLLMSRVPGRMACEDEFMERPEQLTALLAEALRMLWSVDITDCPRERNLAAALKEADYNVKNGLVDTENCEPDTYGEGGFADPGELLQWLKDHQPPCDPVLTHGDFCLPNIFIDGGKISGLIDLGKAGVADRYQDIALCYRSLRHNADGTYGGKVFQNCDPALLFDKLGIEPDWEKIRYYILLDELF